MPNGEVICNLDPPTVGMICDVDCNGGYTTDQTLVTCETGGTWSHNPTCNGMGDIM